MGDKKEVSNRFIEAYERLLGEGLVTSKKEFASSVGVSPSMITEISKGRSSVGTSAIQNIVLLYGISGDWLLTGIGDMLKGAVGQPPSPQQSDDNEPNPLLNQLLDTIREQAEEIGQLKEQVRQLTIEKERLASNARLPDTANAG